MGNQHLRIQKFDILASESLIHTEDIYIQIGAPKSMKEMHQKCKTTKCHIVYNIYAKIVSFEGQPRILFLLSNGYPFFIIFIFKGKKCLIGQHLEIRIIVPP